MAPRKILVTGATGRQGGALIDALLSNDQSCYDIYGLTRDSNSVSALKLAERGIKLIQGDLTEPGPIFNTIGQDVDAVFSVTVSLGGETEEQEAKFLIDAAIKNKVGHSIFTSVDRGGPINSDFSSTNVPHFISKFNIEKYLMMRAGDAADEIKWTILRPVTFMEMFLPGFLSELMGRIVYDAGDACLQFVSVRDIGKVAAQVFENPDLFSGKILTLSGDRLNYASMNRIFQEVAGAEMPVAPEARYPVDDIEKMAHWMKAGGYNYEFDEANKTELGLMNFRTWLTKWAA